MKNLLLFLFLVGCVETKPIIARLDKITEMETSRIYVSLSVSKSNDPVEVCGKLGLDLHEASYAADKPKEVDVTCVRYK